MESSTNDSRSSRIRKSRKRKNILKKAEFAFIEYLCGKMPAWLMPDHLTAIGLLGSVIIFSGLFLGRTEPAFLFISIFGFAINWFGDSLDGRLAYYRNTPRKWYGWSLDVNADWVSTCIIGLGFYYFFPEYKIVSFIFVVAYGGSMLVSIMRYKISDQYIIDVMAFGPTELRIIISIFMILEIFFPGALLVLGLFGSGILIALNLIESYKVLKLGDDRDRREKG